MTLINPSSTTLLSASSGHSFLHRVLSIDTGASEQSVQVYSTYIDFTSLKLTTEGEISGKGYSRSVVTKTAAYTATVNDDVILVNTNAVTITLPDATTCDGKTLTIKKINTEYDEAVTITPDGSQTIDGAASYVINTVNSGAQIVASDGNWYVIGGF